MSVAEEQVVLPAVYEHACTVYRKMEEDAVLTAHDQYEENDSAVLIWSGHLTKLFAELHLSVPYYTSVTRELKRMGCIRQKRRGGGNAPSEWYVLMAPSEEAFLADTRVNHVVERKTKMGMLEQQVRDLSKAVGEVRATNEAIMDILMEREQH